MEKAKEVAKVAEVEAKPLRSKPKWVKTGKGVPVEAGKNWVTGLTHEQRAQAMWKHENTWRKKYNANRGGVEESWSRG